MKISLLDKRWFELLLSIALVLIYYITKELARKVIYKHAYRNDLAPGRSIYIMKFFTFFLECVLEFKHFALK
jgi:hypothetical protein